MPIYSSYGRNIISQERRCLHNRLDITGYAKRHQKAGFQKYIYDALAESNETIVSLEQVKDLYGSLTDIKLCEELIDTYDQASRQIYSLGKAWQNFKNIS